MSAVPDHDPMSDGKIQEVSGSATPISAAQASDMVSKFLQEQAAGAKLDDALVDQLQKVVAATSGEAIAPAAAAPGPS